MPTCANSNLNEDDCGSEDANVQPLVMVDSLRELGEDADRPIWDCFVRWKVRCNQGDS